MRGVMFASIFMTSRWEVEEFLSVLSSDIDQDTSICKYHPCLSSENWSEQ